MLNRIAESLFWIGRYTERAENHARLIDAFYHIREETADEDHLWIRMVQAVGDPAQFEAAHPAYREQDVLFYVALDASHSNSINACVQSTKTNLKTVRERLPEELWDIVNGFALWLRSRDANELLYESPFLFLRKVKENMGMFYGAAQHMMFRDQQWLIMESGRYLERAENTARLLESLYRSIADDEPRVSYYLFSAARALGGVDVYRRLYSDHFTLEHTTSLLVMNELFPRSVQHGLSGLGASLHTIRSMNGADPALDKAIRLVAKVRSELSWLDTSELAKDSLLYSLLNGMAAINQLGAAVGDAFFHTRQGVRA
ncbi:alpha-E domain-containing protein [Paenibacillus medicaginis]|uniref:Alpha-E domain-containing protein n=1 Tax=Paenibacillus medicaginis TaxID=1470560 RepID=A0ABV5C2C5_9BACL